MPSFILILGPQAVGKMAVGKRLAEEINFNFAHNHHSIELALEFFEYGTAGFSKINSGMRDLLFDTMVQYEERGFIFTFVLAYNLESEFEYVKRIFNHFRDNGWTIYVVELEADLQTRLSRNDHPERLDAKKSKRNISISNERLKNSMEKYVLNSTTEYPFPFEELAIDRQYFLKINNSTLEIEDQVELIIDQFDLNEL